MKFAECVEKQNARFVFPEPTTKVGLIRAEEKRVPFGFWWGQRLRALEPCVKPGGNYEMATLELREGMKVSAATARQLVKEAVMLNKTLGDPTRLAK